MRGISFIVSAILFPLSSLQIPLTANTLVCQGNLPPADDDAWQQTTRDRSDFRDLTHLCKLQPVPGRDMGCFCLLSSQSHCSPLLADPALFQSYVLYHWCKQRCGCPTDFPTSSRESGSSGDIDTESTSSSDPMQEENLGILSKLTQGDASSEMDAPLSTYDDMSDGASSVNRAQFAPQDSRLTLTVSTRPKKCGFRCTDFRCATRASGCSCLAKRNDPMRNVWNVYGCGILPKGRRRDQAERTLENAWACPCNATYVSRTCCGTLDGIVWEGPENHLGVVHLDL